MVSSLSNREDDKRLASIIQYRAQYKLKSDKWGLTSITLRQLGNFCLNLSDWVGFESGQLSLIWGCADEERSVK